MPREFAFYSGETIFTVRVLNIVTDASGAVINQISNSQNVTINISESDPDTPDEPIEPTQADELFGRVDNIDREIDGINAEQAVQNTRLDDLEANDALQDVQINQNANDIANLQGSVRGDWLFIGDFVGTVAPIVPDDLNALVMSQMGRVPQVNDMIRSVLVDENGVALQTMQWIFDATGNWDGAVIANIVKFSDFAIGSIIGTFGKGFIPSADRNVVYSGMQAELRRLYVPTEGGGAWQLLDAALANLRVRATNLEATQSSIISGTQSVGRATLADTAAIAEIATRALSDENGESIPATYRRISDSFGRDQMLAMFASSLLSSTFKIEDQFSFAFSPSDNPFSVYSVIREETIQIATTISHDDIFHIDTNIMATNQTNIGADMTADFIFGIEVYRNEEMVQTLASARLDGVEFQDGVTRRVQLLNNMFNGLDSENPFLLQVGDKLLFKMAATLSTTDMALGVFTSTNNLSSFIRFTLPERNFNFNFSFTPSPITITGDRFTYHSTGDYWAAYIPQSEHGQTGVVLPNGRQLLLAYLTDVGSGEPIQARYVVDGSGNISIMATSQDAISDCYVTIFGGIFQEPGGSVVANVDTAGISVIDATTESPSGAATTQQGVNQDITQQVQALWQAENNLENKINNIAPNLISADVGNLLQVGSDGKLFVPTIPLTIPSNYFNQAFSNATYDGVINAIDYELAQNDSIVSFWGYANQNAVGTTGESNVILDPVTYPLFDRFIDQVDQWARGYNTNTGAFADMPMRITAAMGIEQVTPPNVAVGTRFSWQFVLLLKETTSGLAYIQCSSVAEAYALYCAMKEKEVA